MLKILKSVFKKLSDIVDFIIFFLGMILIVFLLIGFLYSSQVGIHRAIVNCDKDCYEQLHLADELPYRDNLVIELRRFAIRCEYVTIAGMKYDQIWQSDWMYDGSPPDDATIVLVTDMDWPVPDEQLRWIGRPIRTPVDEYEIGCSEHIDWTQGLGKRWNPEPVNVPHSF